METLSLSSNERLYSLALLFCLAKTGEDLLFKLSSRLKTSMFIAYPAVGDETDLLNELAMSLTVWIVDSFYRSGQCRLLPVVKSVCFLAESPTCCQRRGV